jgi:mannitol-1-phosphate/altronate dehydrogenase
VLSCDNLPDSGTAARTAVTAHAALRDPDLAAWIEQNVTFPSGMVDRITPETSPQMRDEIEETLGVADRWPVVTEPFSQWVVEDDFCNGRPPLERVGVQFVDDVAPYKLIKTRMLNGGHCALGYLGAIAGHTRTDEAMADPVVRGIVERMLAEEVQPLLPRVLGIDLAEYRRTTLERFADPAIGDTLARLCRRGSVKMPSYLLPSLREAREAQRPRAMLVLAVAAWLLYLRGADLAGRPIEVSDPRADELCALAADGGDDPRVLLAIRSVFGQLGDDAELVAEIADVLGVLSRHGLRAAVAACAPTVESAAA